jgi:preprotein translocase subunit SecG
MLIFIISLILVIAALLVLVVLAQNSKGGGLSSQFGGSGASNQMMGVKKTGDILENLTWGLAIAIMVLSMSTTFFIPDPSTNEAGMSSPNVERAQDQNIVPDISTQSPATRGDPGQPAGDTATMNLEDLVEESEGK